MILDELGAVLTRWTMGGSAVPAAPAAWRAALDEDAELRLLALSGQYLGTLAVTEPVGAVEALADIPALAKPPLPDPLRPRARRLRTGRPVLDFLDGRGWTMHPGDWMPKPGADVPAVYAPWQDWAAAAGPVAETDALTAESWGDFGPAARLAAFATLRRQDPAGASALLAEKIAGESADHRVRLVEILAGGLSEADQPLLASLTSDRAPRVKALAASLLARLGHGGAAEEDAAELAAFFPVQTKGLLRRTRVIVPQEMKTPAQRNRRWALGEALTFDAFARALGLSPEEVLAAWPWGADQARWGGHQGADHMLASMAARSAPDAIVTAMVDALIAERAIDLLVLEPLLERLPQGQRRQAAARLLRDRNFGFSVALSIAGGDGGMDDVLATYAGRALFDALRDKDAKADEQADELRALGLIASRDAAKQALEKLAAAGLIASDPRLDMLRLNAALAER